MKNKLAIKIYSHTHPKIQDIVVSAYVRRKQAWRYGKKYSDYFEKIMQNQLLSEAELLMMQNKMLGDVIQHAYENVPYYKKLFDGLGLTPSDIATVDDLKKLPILEKETVILNRQDFDSKAFSKQDTTEIYTSGTTGNALGITISKDYYQKEIAFRWRHKAWAGINIGAWGAWIAGYPVVPIEQMTPPFWRIDYAEKRILFSSYHMTQDSLRYYAEKLKECQPAFIHGYPSSVYLLAAYILEHDIKGIEPRAVFTSAETLFSYQRKTIESAFGTKLYNWYGCTEVLINIIECSQGSLHVCPDYGVVELVKPNGDPAGHGEEGTMVGTGLGNLAMPLIRYNIGDVAISSDRTCPCGCKFPVIQKIVGRILDYIVTPEGRILGCADNAFMDKTNVKEAQIVQEVASKITVKIVRRETYGEKDTLEILNELRGILGHSIDIVFEFVEHIPREPSGKMRVVLSKLAKERNIDLHYSNEE